MREIKFRAWNKRTNQFGRTATLIEALEFAHNDPEAIEELDYLEFMQYTGLHDKQGKEIYEGDIVHHLKYGGDWEVIWLIDACGFSLKGKGENLMHLSRLCEPNIEVIGNIYLTSMKIQNY